MYLFKYTAVTYVLCLVLSAPLIGLTARSCLLREVSQTSSSGDRTSVHCFSSVDSISLSSWLAELLDAWKLQSSLRVAHVADGGVFINTLLKVIEDRWIYHASVNSHIIVETKKGMSRRWIDLSYELTAFVGTDHSMMYDGKLRDTTHTFKFQLSDSSGIYSIFSSMNEVSENSQF